MSTNPIDDILAETSIELQDEVHQLREECRKARIAVSWLRKIQQDAKNAPMETLSGLYEGKTLFLAKDLLGAIDRALDRLEGE